MVGWATAFSIAMLLNKSLPAHYALAPILWFRALFGLLCILPFVKKADLLKEWPIQILRGLILTIAMTCTYTAYRYLPTHTVALLGASYPFFLMLMAVFFLKERICARRWLLLGLGFLGVIIEIFPSFFHEGLFFSLYYFLPLLSNAMLALSVMMAQWLLSRKIVSTSMLFYGAAVPFTVFSIGGAKDLFSLEFSFRDLVIFASIGIFGALSQVCYLNALKHAPVSFLAPFEYLRIVLLTLLSFLFLGKVPSWISLPSGILIILSCIFLARLNRKKATS